MINGSKMHDKSHCYELKSSNDELESGNWKRKSQMKW